MKDSNYTTYFILTIVVLMLVDGVLVGMWMYNKIPVLFIVAFLLLLILVVCFFYLCRTDLKNND